LGQTSQKSDRDAFAFSPTHDSSAERVTLPVSESNLMLRIAISSAAIAALVAASTSSVFAQSQKSSGEIAATSRLMAEKQESCRLQAKQQKLSFLKRRSFVRECMKTKS
jgi:hypothetical protein